MPFIIVGPPPAALEIAPPGAAAAHPLKAQAVMAVLAVIEDGGSALRRVANVAEHQQ